jgi:hypothetical protein
MTSHKLTPIQPACRLRIDENHHYHHMHAIRVPVHNLMSAFETAGEE